MRLSAIAAAMPAIGAKGGSMSPAPEPSGAAAVMFSVLPHVQILGADTVGISWMTAMKAPGA